MALFPICTTTMVYVSVCAGQIALSAFQLISLNAVKGKRLRSKMFCSLRQCARFPPNCHVGRVTGNSLIDGDRLPCQYRHYGLPNLRKCRPSAASD